MGDRHYVDIIGVLKKSFQQMKGKWLGAIGVYTVYMLIIIIASKIPFLGIIASALISGPLIYGVIRYFLSLERGEPTNLEMLFSGFQNFTNNFATYILQSILIFLWSLLLVVPGIIKSLSYSLAFYVRCDNPELSATESIKKSKELMNGHKKSLFLLMLIPLGVLFSISIIGAIFTVIGFSLVILFYIIIFLGGIFVGPYSQLVMANFYDEVRGLNPDSNVIVEDYFPQDDPFTNNPN